MGQAVTTDSMLGDLGDDGTVLFLDYDDGYMNLCMCYNEQNCTFKKVQLLYGNLK